MLPHLFLLLFTCAALPSSFSQSAGLQLKDGDRIILVGGTLIEREQRYGYWETALTVLHPELNLQFRNLGWSGDTVYGDARAGFGTAADGYRLLKEQILAAKPTIIVLAYGGNESFDGEAGLPRFREGMRRLLSDLTPLHARIVLLAPIDHLRPIGGANHNIQLYRMALRDLAKEERSIFGEILGAAQVQASSENANWSDDGIQLNAAGYRSTASAFCRLFGESPTEWAKGKVVQFDGANGPLDDLRKAIVAKNVHYFNRYRPQNETYLFGFRKHEQGQNASEVPEFDKLVAEAEAQIVRLRKSLQVNHLPDRVDR